MYYSLGRLCKRALMFQFDSPMIVHQSQHHTSLLLRYLSISPNQREAKEQSFDVAVSFLVNSCGLSPDSAIYASKRVRLVNLKKPDAVVHLLNTQGFSQNQISSMIRKFPSLLRMKPEKTLLPKLKYLYTVEASKAEVVRIFSICPRIFKRSLVKHIIPAFGLLKDVFGTNRMAVETFNNYAPLLCIPLTKHFIPNITTLRDEKVSEAGIMYMINHHPRVLLISRLDFVKTVEKVKVFGIYPSSSLRFVSAIKVMNTMSESTREKKLGLFRRWGWSKGITVEAFRKFPSCIAYSEEKINAGMDFFVNRAGLEASYIARFPILLGFSLEERVIPRYSVVQVLLSKGLMSEGIVKTRFYQFFKIPGECFRNRFVNPYLEKAPELLGLYLSIPSRH